MRLHANPIEWPPCIPRRWTGRGAGRAEAANASSHSDPGEEGGEAAAGQEGPHLEQRDEGSHLIQVREVSEGVGNGSHELAVCVISDQTSVWIPRTLLPHAPTCKVRAENLLEDAV